MKLDIIEKLTSKDDISACEYAEKIILESQETNKWYKYFDEVSSLLSYPKSLVRNRAINILAANAKWDKDNKFDLIIDDYLSHVIDEKPITARECIKSLATLGQYKPKYISKIIETIQSADLSKYKDSMRPLIEKDIYDTTAKLSKQK